MEQNTLEVTERSEVFEFTSLRDMVNQALQQNFGEIQLSDALSTGFKDLDNAIKGFKKGELTTIAVKPGMGKTALMLSIANNVAVKNNHPVAIFSSERSSSKITNRLIESETGMSLDKLIKGNLRPSERDHVFSLVSHMAKADIFLDDTPNLSANELMNKTRQLKINNGVELIIIDYLELLSHTYNESVESREEQLNQIVNEIKQVAVELDIPVLLFSQIPGHYPGNILNRPTLNDVPVFLAEHTDVLLFLHRSDLRAASEKGYVSNDIVEVVVAKYDGQKNNEIVELRFIESLAKFTDK
jgi:replicative DNA helicase